MTLYQLAAERIWNLPVDKLTLYHLRSNTPCTCGPRSQGQLESARALVQQVAEKIAGGEFPATENQYCPCDFPEHCPYYRHKYGKAGEKETEVDILRGMAIEDAVEQYVDLQSKVKTLQLELGEVRQMIIDFCEAEDITRVFGNRYAITYGVVERSGFIEDEVRALLEPKSLWDKVLSFDQAKVRELLESAEIAKDLRTRLEALKHTLSESPRLWVKKLAEEE